MYAVCEQLGVTTDSLVLAEWEDDQVVIHRTREGADAALGRVATEMGRDPGIWGNLSVHAVRRRPFYAVVRD